MKLKFDENEGTKKIVGGVTFTDYTNGAFSIEISGRYVAIVYDNGDSIYLRDSGHEYYVWFIKTHDGLSFTFKE